VALRLLDRAKRHLRKFEIASGTLLAAMGLLFITGNEAAIMNPTTASENQVVVTTTETPPTAPATCSAGAPRTPLPAPRGEVAERSEAGEGLPAAAARIETIPTMVEFVSATCPICQRMQPVVAAAERGCAVHGIRVRQLDVGTPAGRAAASERGVLGVPTFLFLDSEGKEVARLVGQQPQEVLIQSLEVLAGQKCDGFRPITGSAGSAIEGS